MAQDVLGKTVRIDDKRYDPKGAKLEVWTKGRHKYLIRYVDPEGKNAPESSKILYINTTGKAEKPNASLSDDEVIKEYLLEIKQTVLFNIEVGLPPHPMCHQILNVIQDPYSNETINKRIYGDGSPYYLNNGCSISIEWLGKKPNPDFVLGTFSNPDDAERYYRRDLIPGESVSGFKKKRGPSRYLQWNRDAAELADGIDRNAAWYLLNGVHKGFNKDGVVILPESPEEDGVIITSGVDNADDSSTLPTSSWVINEGPVNPINDFDNNGIDDSFEGPFSEGLFRDKSYIFGKKVTIELPAGVNEENLVWTNKMDNLQYISNSLPEGSKYKETILIPTGFTGSNGEPVMTPVEVTETKPIIQYFENSYENAFKDSNIILEVIERFKSMVISKNGIRDYDLKLCSPDSESCKFIDYISPLEDIKPEVEAPVEAPVGAPPVDNGKIKLNIQGLFDAWDYDTDVTPGSSQSVFEIKAKTDMPSFLVWTGEIPKTEGVDVFIDLELDDEYLESDFEGIDESVGEFLAGDALEYAEQMKQAQNDDVTRENENNGGGNVDGTTPLVGDGDQSKFTNVKGVPENTPLPNNPVLSAAFNNVPLYSQYDGRWAKSKFDWSPKRKCGDGSTVSSSGCGPSAMSMCINFWASKGIYGVKAVNPAIVANHFANYGGRVCGSGSGLGQVNKTKFKAEFGMILKSVTDAQLMKFLKLQLPAIISGNHYSGYNYNGKFLTGKYTGGHFLCLTGIDSQNRVRVNDSGNNPAGGKAIVAFKEGKTPAQSRNVTQTFIVYPATWTAPASIQDFV